MTALIEARQGPLAITEERGDGRTYVFPGENTAEAKRQADLASTEADRASSYVDDAAAVVASVSSVLGIADGYLPVKRKIGAISSGSTANILMASDGYFERTTGTATMLGYIPLLPSDLLEANIYIHFPATGTFSDTPDAQLYISTTTAVGSRIDGVLSGGEYVVTLPISGAPDQIRVRWATTSDGRVAEPYVTYDGQALVDPATVGGRRKIDEWIDEVVAQSGNMLALGTSAAGAATYSADRSHWSFPSGSNANKAVQYVNGVALAADYVSFLIKITDLAAYTWRDVGLYFDHGRGSGGVLTLSKAYRYGDYLVVRGLAAAGGGANPRYVQIYPDTRSSSGVSATVIDWQFLGCFIGDIDPMKLLADPERLLAACAVKQQQTALVSATAAGDAEFTSLPDAVKAGFGTVLTSLAHERLTDGCYIPPYCTIKGVTVTGISNTQERPIVSCGTSLAIGDFTATAADANVQFLSLAYDPVQVWEVVTATGVVTPLGEPTGVSTGWWKVSANEAAVRATAGSYWYGAGSEGTGLYIRPVGDVTTGKTWEIPALGGYYTVNAFAGGGIEGLDVRYGMQACIYRQRGDLHTANCRVRYSGVNGLSMLGNGTWIDRLSLFSQNGNDGANWDSDGLEVGLFGTALNDNNYDGLAGGHLDGASGGFSRVYGDYSTARNGKQGTVHIGPTDCEGVTRSFENREKPFLIDVTTASKGPFAVNMLIYCDGAVKISDSTNAANPTGYVTGTWASIDLTNADITAVELAAV